LADAFLKNNVSVVKGSHFGPGLGLLYLETRQRTTGSNIRNSFFYITSGFDFREGRRKPKALAGGEKGWGSLIIRRRRETSSPSRPRRKRF